jgi:hypothetical protein
MWTGEQLTTTEEGFLMHDVESPLGFPPVYFFDSRIFEFSTILA